MPRRKLISGAYVKVIKDGTGEFTNCIGRVSCFEEDWRFEDEISIGVAFGKADNTIPFENGDWGAWFDRKQLRITNQELSPICPVPV